MTQNPADGQSSYFVLFQMKTRATKTFSLTIFLSLTLAAIVFIALLLDRFDNIEKAESEHIRHQNALILLKDIRFHVIQIQQFLTDASLTHRQAGFADAKHHFDAAKTKLAELAGINPDIKPQCELLTQKVILTYEAGVRMTVNYLNNDLESGHANMKMLDANSEELARNLDEILMHLDAELQQSIADNAKTIQRDQLILILSVPVVLGFFCVLLIHLSKQLKRQMNALAYRTTELNTVLNTVASAIVTIDKTGIVKSFNQAAESIFGYRADEIIGQNVSCLMPSAIALKHDSYIQKYRDTLQATIIGKRREVEAQRKNGELFPVMLQVKPMEIDGDMYFSGVLDDISETKILQAQLGQAQKLEAIGQLAAGVAHEINTPIQYIGDNLCALADNFADIGGYLHALEDLDDEALKLRINDLSEQFDLAFIMEDSPKAIQQALEGVNRVTEIVKAMKTFSHVEAGQDVQAVNLHELLTNTLTISRHQYKNVANIETDFAPDVGFIEAYANELSQVFLNLIINAVHAIEETQNRGLIRITTRKLDHSVEILIQDNGSGIPPAIQEKVFNLFFTTKEVGKGTGQGLSLSHTIVVEKHFGQLFFESTPNAGTTFHIQLPIKHAPV
jgi:PAS domain S-box-containing protein